MKRTILFTLALVGTSGAFLALAEKAETPALAPKLNIDPSPPERSGPFGGYADIVSEISPSVVSIFTTREVQHTGAGSPQEIPDLFDSPLFRDFFGQRGLPRPEQGRRTPRQLPKQRGLGSGVILSEDGYILTNNHVVEKASDIQVELDSGVKYQAEIVATDPSTDLAVIKVDAGDLPAATIGDSENLRAGDIVLAIGSPFGLDQTVTTGIVSATGRDNLNIVGYENFIQTDASINPGNSGGALIDNRGRVVGINTAIFSRSGGNVGIGFAIPVNMAVHVAGELITHGKIERGYLGVTLAAMNENLAEALGVENRGVVVNDVMPDAPASAAGFKAGDVIVAVNGDTVEDIADVRRKVGGAKPGTEVLFQVNRAGRSVKLTASIGKMPTDLLAGASPDRAPQEIEEGALEGVRLAELDSEMRDRLGLGGSERGVVVLQVTPGSKAAEAGLRRGDVITEVNRTEVSTPQEAYARASKRKGKATLLRVTDGRTNRFLAIG